MEWAKSYLALGAFYRSVGKCPDAREMLRAGISEVDAASEKTNGGQVTSYQELRDGLYAELAKLYI